MRSAIDRIDLENTDRLDKVDLKTVFGVMAHVARRFDRHGLSLHATVAYLKLISLWTCLLECIPLSLLQEEKAEHFRHYNVAMTAIAEADNWLRPIQDAVMRNVKAIDGQTFTETWHRIRKMDVPDRPEASGSGTCDNVSARFDELKRHPLDSGLGRRSGNLLGGRAESSGTIDQALG